MKLSNLKYFWVFIIILSIGLYLYRLNRSEVLETTLSYIIEDFFIDHADKNLMLGSSSIKRLDHLKYLSCGSWVNRGIGNSVIEDLSRYVDFTPLSIKPKIILLYAGENDISRGINTETTINAMKALIDTLIEKFPESSIHIIAIKPSPKRELFWKDFHVVNGNVKKYVQSLNSVFFHSHFKQDNKNKSLNFVADGVHLSDNGYRVFTKGVKEACEIK